MNLKALKAYLDTMNKRGIPGCCIVVRQRGKRLLGYGSGASNLDSSVAFTPDTLCYVYSCTKVVTCVAALRQYEEGKFLLDDPVDAFLPEFSQMRVRITLPNGEVEERIARERMTIRHLFTMTSGLDYNLHSPAIDMARKKPGLTTREGVKALAKEPLLFEPGTHWYYGLSHDVLAALVEVWSGMRFGDFLHKSIFAPLGMKDTSFLLNQKEKQLATLYTYSGDNNQPEAIAPDLPYRFGSEYESGGAGLISTAEDMARFADALACDGISPDGYRMLAPSTVNLMRMNQLKGQVARDFNWLAGYGYGLGVRTLVDGAQAGVGGPSCEFGWSGAVGVYLSADPANGVSVYYAQHVLNYPLNIHGKLRNLVTAGLQT